MDLNIIAPQNNDWKRIDRLTRVYEFNKFVCTNSMDKVLNYYKELHIPKKQQKPINAILVYWFNYYLHASCESAQESVCKLREIFGVSSTTLHDLIRLYNIALYVHQQTQVEFTLVLSRCAAYVQENPIKCFSAFMPLECQVTPLHPLLKSNSNPPSEEKRTPMLDLLANIVVLPKTCMLCPNHSLNWALMPVQSINKNKVLILEGYVHRMCIESEIKMDDSTDHVKMMQLLSLRNKNQAGECESCKNAQGYILKCARDNCNKTFHKSCNLNSLMCTSHKSNLLKRKRTPHGTDGEEKHRVNFQKTS